MEWRREISLEGNDNKEGFFPLDWIEFDGSDKFVRLSTKKVSDSLARRKSPSSNWLKFESLHIIIQHRK